MLTFYTAGKIWHAPKFQALRDEMMMPVKARWIDLDNDSDFVINRKDQLWNLCYEDVRDSDFVLLYCEDFEEVTTMCPVPIVIAGGKKIEERDALQMAKDAINKGAVGVDMGRNIFLSDSPIGMIRAVREIVHNNISVDDAYKIYEQGPKGL